MLVLGRRASKVAETPRSPPEVCEEGEIIPFCFQVRNSYLVVVTRGGSTNESQVDGHSPGDMDGERQ